MISTVFRRNLAYKIISVGIAVLLYFVAYSQMNPQRTREVDVQTEVRGLAEDMVISQPPTPYTIRVSGPAPVVENLANRGVRAFIDASGAPAGDVRLPVAYELPNNVSFTGKPLVEVALARKTRRRFDVTVRHTNPSGGGFDFKQPRSTPRQVSVSGLEADVNRVTRVVAYLDTSQATGPVEDEAEVIAQDQNQQTVPGVDIDPPRVLVSLGVKEATGRKRLLVSPEFEGEMAPGWRIADLTLEPATVLAAGAQDQLAELSNLKVRIDVSGLSEDRTRSVPVLVPPGLRILDPEEGTVRATLKVERVAVASPSPPPAVEKPEGAPPSAEKPNPPGGDGTE